MTAANVLALIGGAAAIIVAFGLGWVLGRVAIARAAMRHDAGFAQMVKVMRGMSGGR